jgi:hypothetical protein
LKRKHVSFTGSVGIPVISKSVHKMRLYSCFYIEKQTAHPNSDNILEVPRQEPASQNRSNFISLLYIAAVS